jgi:putative ABC transport system permease protein
VRRDIRDAWRHLGRRPVLTAVAVLTLAIGTGANTTFFSLLDALLLRPLPLPGAGRLVFVTETDAAGSPHAFTPAMVQAFAERQDVFASMCGYVGGGPMRVEVGSEEFSAGWEVVGPGFFSTLGLRPEAGRFFEQADAGHLVAVVTDRFWRQQLAGDPDVVGRRIRLEGTPVSIIGVVPNPYAGLQLESRADVAILASSFNAFAGTVPAEPVPFSRILGRLGGGTTIDMARANLTALWPGVIASALPADLPASERSRYQARRLTVTSASRGSSFLRTRYAGTLELLVGLTVWMLVIAGVNLAGALLAGAAAREQELRVRVALGASRRDLVRQMLVESALLCLAGTLAGLPLVAGATPRLLGLLWPTREPLPVSVAPDWRVLTASIALLAAVTVAASLAQAWLATRPSAPGAGPGARAVTGSASRWGRGLLVAEIALSVVLLAGAGLFIRTLVNLRQTPLGFNPTGVFSVNLTPRPGAPPDANDILHARELAERLTALPRIEAVGFINHGLLLGVDSQLREPVAPSGVAPGPADAAAMVEEVSPGFFRTLTVPIVGGRAFTWADAPGTPRVAIVTATEAARLFAGANAVGRHIRVGTDAAYQDVTIVGVVADSRLEDVHVPHPATVFLSLGQRPGRVSWTFLHVRVTGDPGAPMTAIRTVVTSLGRQSVGHIDAVAGHVDIALARERLAALLGALFGGLAVGLVALGTYGLFSHWVTRRTRELGVRMALGASPARLRRWILGQSLGLAAAGVAIGVPAGLAAARLAGASAFLFGLTPHDPAVLTAAAGAIAVAAVTAAWGPARRVVRLDPLSALRTE